MDKEHVKALADLATVDQSKLEKLYEVAKIDALSQTKGEVVRWVGAWAGALALITTILGTFGINQLINNRVEQRVSAEVDRLKEEIEETQVLIHVALNESRDNLLKIDSTLDQALELEGNFKQKITEIEPLVKDLSVITDQAEFKLVLDNLIADFYTIKQVKAHLDLEYTTDISELLEKYQSVDVFAITTLDLLRSDDDESSLAQFVINGQDITSINENRITYSLNLFPPFERELNGKSIDEFRATKLRFRDATEHQEVADLAFDATNHLKSVHVRVTVNGVSVLNKTVAGMEFEKSANENGTFYILSEHDLEGSLLDPRAALEAGVTRRLEETTQATGSTRN